MEAKNPIELELENQPVKPLKTWKTLGLRFSAKRYQMLREVADFYRISKNKVVDIALRELFKELAIDFERLKAAEKKVPRQKV